MSDVITALGLLNDAIFVSLVNTTLQITLLICLIALIIGIFRIRSAPTRYSLWLFVLLAMLILPILTPFIPQIDFTQFHQQRLAGYGLNDRTGLGMESIDAGDMSMAGGSVSSASAEKSILGEKTNVSLINPVSIAYFIWCAGALSMLCRTIVVYGKLRKLRLCSSDVESKAALEALSRLREKLGIRRTVALKLSSQVYAPIGLGVFYPAIILPDDVMDGGPVEELEMILAHELAHIKRLDYLVRFLQNVLKVFFFFHPLFQLMKRNLAREREHICDDWVIHLTEHRSRYAECLVDMLERVASNSVSIPVTVAMAERKQDIPGRIDMIVDEKRKVTMRISRKALSAVFIIGFLAIPIIGGIGLVRFAGARAASEEGQIVFSRGGNIWVMGADGGNERQLTFGGLTDVWPAWSPDGRQIAFRRLTDGVLYVMNTDGTNVKQLTSCDDLGLEASYGPTWSPDGKQIAFQSRVEPGRYAIHVMDVDGSNVKILLEEQTALDAFFAWSPDGSKIAYCWWPVDRDSIWVMDADGENRKKIHEWGGNGGIDWSPEGDKVVFTSVQDSWENWQTTDIYVINADGTGLKRLTQPGPAWYGGPVWSPDGTKIAFCADLDQDGADIYVMNADGSNVQQLTNTPGETEWNPDWTASSYAVSPAGKLRSTWGKIKTLLRSR